MTGDPAKYCRTCKANQAQTNNPIDCSQCEGRCPALDPANHEAFQILMAGRTQIRAGFGGFYGFDYPALRLVAELHGVDIDLITLRKIQAVERHLLTEQSPKGE